MQIWKSSLVSFFSLLLRVADYDAPSKATSSSKGRAPSPPTVRVGHNRLEAPQISQPFDKSSSSIPTVPLSSMHDTVRSTISTGSFDYLRGPRRCVLRVDRNKGLGFVLSATGDYDHTITAVEKVRSRIRCIRSVQHLWTSSVASSQPPMLLVCKSTMKCSRLTVSTCEMSNMNR